MATILGIDWGQKRVGLARADVRARIAEPYVVLDHGQDIFDQLRQIVKQEDVTTIIIGLPRNMSGEETYQSHEVRQFAAALGEELQCRTVLQDETLTTQAAADIRTKYPDASMDCLAATFILEDYLQSL